MAYKGRVVGGVIVYRPTLKLEEGSEVRFVPIRTRSKRKTKQLPSLAERFGDVIGAADGLPSDLAENHDHYIHGVPKRRKR